MSQPLRRPRPPGGEPPEPAIEPGRSLVRIEDRGTSIAERLWGSFERFAWRTPLHAMRLRGRFPLKLTGVPVDPIAGDPQAGAELMAGELAWGHARMPLDTLDFTDATQGEGLVEHLQSFGWLRDLAAAADRATVAPLAEAMMRVWLDGHAQTVDDLGWRADLWGRRLLAWIMHAPLILSSSDLVYRSAVLNTLARGARHLDRVAEKAPVGLPRIAACAGQIAAGLMVPGGEPRAVRGEAALTRALAGGLSVDGGIVSRSPADLLDAIEVLSCLLAVYEDRRREAPEALLGAIGRAVPALLGVAFADGRLSSWQGAGPLEAARVARVIAGSGVRTRPQRQSRDWGFQRLAGGATVVVADCAPPPASRVSRDGCASTLAFEMADGPHRLIVNCGGDRPWRAMPATIREALRTTAAHSTLVLADSNSTAILADGTLGRGVAEVEMDRQEQESASRIEAAHDGYVRRFGLSHRRKLILAADGRELGGEDVLLPAGSARGASPGTVGFAVRFHLGPRVEAVATADGMAALLRIMGGPAWQFRCRGGTLSIEESIWIDEHGRPVSTAQLVVAGETPPGGTSLAWTLRRAA